MFTNNSTTNISINQLLTLSRYHPATHTSYTPVVEKQPARACDTLRCPEQTTWRHARAQRQARGASRRQVATDIHLWGKCKAECPVAQRAQVDSCLRPSVSGQTPQADTTHRTGRHDSPDSASRCNDTAIRLEDTNSLTTENSIQVNNLMTNPLILS